MASFDTLASDDFNFFIEEDDMDYVSTLDLGDSVTWEYGDPLKVQ